MMVACVWKHGNSADMGFDIVWDGLSDGTGA